MKKFKHKISKRKSKSHSKSTPKPKTVKKIAREIKLKKVPSKLVSKKKLKKYIKIVSHLKSNTYIEKKQHSFAVSQPQNNENKGFELPQNYGDNKAVLLVRDPWWIFAYWEVNEERERVVLQQIKNQGFEPQKKVLRVYDVTGVDMPHAHSYFDIEVGGANNWYVNVDQPDREWIVELGMQASNGHFFVLVRSNRVRTPRFGVSDIVDEEWMLPDELYWKLFGLDHLRGQKSSLDVREIFERYLRNITSSKPAPGSETQAKLIGEEFRSAKIVL